ncbi:hypothetical protein [Natronococcus sp.]|uniref:hypothetical protein n=1 Tax=Natronococcus sp. TaxID=35747 RepID=UPI0025FD5AC2|nr:hypothetical protein [Natronococcus sp.]
MSSAEPEPTRVTLTDALEHAITVQYLLLFGLIVVGWLVAQGGTGLLAIGVDSTSGGAALVSGLVLTTGGFGVAFVGVLASAYKRLSPGIASTDRRRNAGRMNPDYAPSASTRVPYPDSPTTSPPS